MDHVLGFTTRVTTRAIHHGATHYLAIHYLAIYYLVSAVDHMMQEVNYIDRRDAIVSSEHIGIVIVLVWLVNIKQN